MKKKIASILISITLSIIVAGCEQDKKNIETDVLYTYIDSSSNDAQHESSIGTIVEQPILDENSQKIGKRLYVDSSREKLNKNSLLEFCDYIKNIGINYEEIVFSIGNNEALYISLKDRECWYCNISENMELKKIKKIYN